MRRNRATLSTVTALTACLLAAAAPAAAAPPQPVQDDPADWTPHLTDGEVWALARVGDTVLVAGEFGAVTSADKATRYERHNLMAFRISDGTVLDLAPKFDGPVYALAPGPDGTVIAAGDFRAVDGLPQRAITRLDLVTGRPVPGFAPKITGEVLTLARHDHDLYVGGRIAVDGQTYSRGLIRMSADTGALDPAFDARLAAPADRPVKVQDVAISPDGARLLAIGSFTTADSNPREQVAMLDISTPAAKVTDWHTGFYGLDDCGDGFHTYLRAADFSPDGRFAVIVTSGHSSDDELACGTAARYETAGHGEQQPTWVNHTGGNSLFAVEVTPAAVYVGGHLQWLDNPDGDKSKGPGAVDRKGIGAIDPRSGRALPWNPTRTRGEGLRAFLSIAKGLFVGSDTDRLGHEYHGRVGFFPRRSQ
ncbi:PKD domain containing protein [Catellatospora bangladeshensis]|uniref:Uncharacterized protein n=1 Tax=Catellatospora bangladeshensis TaxID=310355 RepID=A0A8J3JQ97_9ACTN|nr:PKD domain containing protein [Catellatospora bangladeshensis]GIF84937.1 hypothetical protein Cba03nite_62860 [Catellatospora bangladeshensis]